jgi:NADH-quinone oxidoreductase subunit J
MSFSAIVFYVFSAIAVASACGVIFSRNPVYSALFLVAAFVSCAGVWLLLHAEFLAIVLVLVYVGAVMVLFLFVLMMLDINLARLREGFWRYFPLALALAGGMVWLLSRALAGGGFASSARFAAGERAENTRALGAVLYTDYVYAFELAAVVLLVAIVAAVALTLRRRPGAIKTDAGEQAKTSPQGRVRLLAGGDNPVIPPSSAPSSKTQKGETS